MNVANLGRKPYRSLSADVIRDKSTISNEEFMQLTRDVWQMPTENTERAGHPAPSPVELFTYGNDLVFDSFNGSNTTAALHIARCNRRSA